MHRRRRPWRSTPTTCPPGSPACRSTPPPPSPTCAAVGCTVDGTVTDGDRLTATAAAVAARPRPTRTTSSRRSPGSSATRTCRRVLPDGPGRPRAHPRAAAAPPRRARRSPAPGYVEVDLVPVRRDRRPSTRSGCPPTTCAPHASGWPTRSRTEEPRCTTTTCCPGLLRPRRATSAAAPPTWRSSRSAPVAPPDAGSAAPILPRRPAARPTRSSDELDDALPDAAAAPRPPCWPASVDRAGWWGAGRAAGWADAVEVVREVGRALGVDVRVAGRAAGRPGTRAAAPQLFVGRRRVSGTPASCTRRSAGRSGVPPRTAVARARPRRPARRAPAVADGAATSRRYPVAKEDVALVVADDVPAAERGGDAARGCRARCCESVRLFDVYTGEQVGAGHKSLAFALRFRAPDRTLTEEETAAARDAAVALAVAAARGRQR